MSTAKRPRSEEDENEEQPHRHIAINRHVKMEACWLPHPEFVQNFVSKVKKAVKHHDKPEKAEDAKDLSPSVAKLQDLFMKDAVVRMYVEDMLKEEPIKALEPISSEADTSKGQMQERDSLFHRPEDIPELIHMINHIVHTAPAFTGNEDQLIGCPLNALLDDFMATPSGFALFRLPQVNAALKEVLNEWCTFLSGPGSQYVLTTEKGGWLSPAAVEVLKLDEIQCQQDQPNWGFTSWNNFFIRKFKDGARPFAGEKDDQIIASSCECTFYHTQTNVTLRDKFWVKEQPYSLSDMLNNDPKAEQFVGGTIFQAFLSAKSYHRWHSPISGRVVDVQNVDGTYYSETESAGYDPSGPDLSEGYLTAVAARGIIYIEADNKEIGLISIIYVGMSEVSSVIFTVKKGEKVSKGDQLGYFQFGGSTHCILFRNGVVTNFDHFKPKDSILLGSQIYPPCK